MLGCSLVLLQREPEGTERLRPNFGQTRPNGRCPRCLAVHTQLGVPLRSLPILHGTTKLYLLGPDSLFPDYLVVVVVGNEKRKMFIFPKQRGT